MMSASEILGDTMLRCKWNSPSMLMEDGFQEIEIEIEVEVEMEIERYVG